jgi:hypothetical protein
LTVKRVPKMLRATGNWGSAMMRPPPRGRSLLNHTLKKGLLAKLATPAPWHVTWQPLLLERTPFGMNGKHVHDKSELLSPGQNPRHSPLSTHGADEHGVQINVLPSFEKRRKNPGRQMHESTRAVVVEPWRRPLPSGHGAQLPSGSPYSRRSHAYF